MSHLQMAEKKVPPEGGWGYMIALSFLIVNVCGIAPIQSFGMVYGDFLKQFGEVGYSTTLTSTSFFAILSFTGILANPLITKYSSRTIGLSGAFIFSIGAFFCYFANSLNQLIFAYGVLQGIGFGIILAVSITSLNQYFEKRRAFINSLAQSGYCAVSIFVPVVAEYLMEKYGFRGTVAIFAAYASNVFVAAMILQPVEWHLKKNTSYELIEVCNSEKLKMNFTQLTEELKEDDDLFENKNELEEESKIMEQDISSSRQTIKRNKKFNSGILQSLIENLDLNLLRDPIFLNMACGIGCSFHSDINFIALTPLFLFHRGFNGRQVAFFIMTVAIADLISRLLLTLFTSRYQVKSRYIILAGTTCSMILKNCFIFTENYYLLLIILAGIGFFRTWLQTPMPICFTEQYDIDRFPAVWGLFQVICGIMCLTIGPVTGFVSKTFENDFITVQCLGIFSLICIIPWFIELCSIKSLGRKETE